MLCRVSYRCIYPKTAKSRVCGRKQYCTSTNGPSLSVLCPGQGSQYVGMGKDIVDNIPSLKSLMDIGSEAIGDDLASIMWNGPQATLNLTVNAQPAIIMHAALVHGALKAMGVDLMASASMTAGHSVGEYASAYISGAIDLDVVMGIAQFRGEVMQKCVGDEGARMVALMGCDRNRADEILKEYNDTCGDLKHQPLGIGSINAPKQVVFSGASKPVEYVIQLAKKRRIRSIELQVSAAFHSPQMTKARSQIESRLSSAPFRKPCIPIYTNYDGSPVTTSDEIKTALINQTDNTVQWSTCIANMHEAGAQKFVAIGPAKGVIGQLQQNLKSIDKSNFTLLATWEHIKQYVETNKD